MASSLRKRSTSAISAQIEGSGRPVNRDTMDLAQLLRGLVEMPSRVENPFDDRTRFIDSSEVQKGPSVGFLQGWGSLTAGSDRGDLGTSSPRLSSSTTSAESLLSAPNLEVGVSQVVEEVVVGLVPSRAELHQLERLFKGPESFA